MAPLTRDFMIWLNGCPGLNPCCSGPSARGATSQLERQAGSLISPAAKGLTMFPNELKGLTAAKNTTLPSATPGLVSPQTAAL
jgi:hypothetical protein